MKNLRTRKAKTMEKYGNQDENVVLSCDTNKVQYFEYI